MMGLPPQGGGAPIQVCSAAQTMGDSTCTGSDPYPSIVALPSPRTGACLPSCPCAQIQVRSTTVTFSSITCAGSDACPYTAAPAGPRTGMCSPSAVVRPDPGE